MANVKERLRKELAVQVSIEGEKCQSELLLMVVDVMKTQSQWIALVNCEWYESRRFYRPTDELLKLVEKIKGAGE